MSPTINDRDYRITTVIIMLIAIILLLVLLLHNAKNNTNNNNNSPPTRCLTHAGSFRASSRGARRAQVAPLGQDSVCV